ncbi:MAG: GGDEF domain-containing protein [Terracidiphilus sp.]|jgi:diguanylate cyclase (GGDEF)-like protein
MKRLITAVAIILGWACVAWAAAAPAPLTTLRAVSALSDAEASRALPVAFGATVTYWLADNKMLFVQDGDNAVYVQAATDAQLIPGDRILVQGKTNKGLRPYVDSDRITLLRHGALPKPIKASFDDLMHDKLDCMLVTVHAVVRSADTTWIGDLRSADGTMSHLTRLLMSTDGGFIDAFVVDDETGAAGGLLDAEVEVTGVAGGSFDGKMQKTGSQLHVSSLADVKVLKRAASDPWSLPITPMDRILTTYHVNNLTGRVRVHGTITYYQYGSAVVLQDGPKSLWITTQTQTPLQIGDLADATGLPDSHNNLMVLTLGEVQDSHVRAPITPQPATWEQLTTSAKLFDLVSIEGQVVTEVREAAQDEYVLSSDGRLFNAIYRHPPASEEVGHVIAPMIQIPLGSRVRVTGICVLEDSNPFDHGETFDILMRTPDDIAVVAKPSLLNIRNLILIVGLLLLLVFVAIARGWTLERKVRRQTAAMSARTEAEAELERQRSRILEDINGSQPLADILEEIAKMVSAMLNGAPCWCEVADGPRLGKCPQEPHNLRIVSATIDARLGPALGALFVGLDPEALADAHEAVALHNGARLATLAIETRRLYSDLLHRSEFDLLTEVHNRFSLEKRLDAQIEMARRNAGIFGLIYVDLDEFKQVNDIYGHRIGDLYLQETARRMKQQLRSHDLLARLGGDEFAVLLPMVRNRAGVEEIAQRLEHCFDMPLVLEGHALQGSASFGIALYPEDGATKDSLLSTADTGMYAAKNGKRQSEVSLAQSPLPELVAKDRA